MRFLLISDTHGKLGVINDLAERAQADAVIHAGDFGFYADDSYERLTARELRLLLVHSDLPNEMERTIAVRGLGPSGRRGESEWPAYLRVARQSG